MRGIADQINERINLANGILAENPGLDVTI